VTVAIDRLTATGDEAGTPPGDRKFRPDVQGMRAIAILLALVYHAGLPGFSGGYVGIEVFFVISGFVITGLLLREREGTGGTSLRSFYGRRARRIIPAATLVIIVTVIVSYHALGPLVGHETAVDGQWAALFLANVHFDAVHTNYLIAQAPPSPLLNYWSLGVEEQFYILYPTLFVLIGWWARKKYSFRACLTVVLVAVIVVSYATSIVLTSTDAPSAYFSLFTRSWELALGGLIAVHGRYFQRMPQAWAAVASWAGLLVILLTSVTLTGSSAYPGALVAIPTLGAGVVIAAGAAQPTWGVERMLRRRSFQFLAAISFPLYLWHWPILEIAAQSRGVTSLPAWESIPLLLLAGVVATLTYYFFENPIRHSRFLARRRWASVLMGLCLIAATLVVTTYQQRRPTVNLGILATVTTGLRCPAPSPSVVSGLRSEYDHGHVQESAENKGLQRPVVIVGDSTACTLLPGLEAVGPSYGMQFENGSVVGCGIVSGTLAPQLINGANIVAGTSQCQGAANTAETDAIDRYHPSIIVWGSTDERRSIVASTKAGSTVLTLGTPAWRTEMLRRINDRVREFVATGAKLVLLLEPPAAIVRNWNSNADELGYGQMNDLLKEVAARHPHDVAVVNLERRVCPIGPPCQYVVDGLGSLSNPTQAVRPDTVHYMSAGALWTARWLVPQIDEAAQKLTS
jgi:peptidoglycan/LPS O-acetylase OafA/YrhL